MARVRSLEDIPFMRKAPRELLNLVKVGIDQEPDPDFGGYGYGLVERLELMSSRGGSPIRLTKALVLALHSSEEENPYPDDIQLEFELEDGDEGYTATAPLERFLAAWVPRIDLDHRCVVLALCNFFDTKLIRPAVFGDVPVYYARGEVFSYISYNHDAKMNITHVNEDILELVADEWIVL